jgi:hypothetical protein
MARTPMLQRRNNLSRSLVCIVGRVMEFKIGDGSGWSADVFAVHPYHKPRECFCPGKQPENVRLLFCDLSTINSNKPYVVRARLNAQLPKPLAS